MPSKFYAIAGEVEKAFFPICDPETAGESKTQDSRMLSYTSHLGYGHELQNN
jgi:hypothetical protein